MVFRSQRVSPGSPGRAFVMSQEDRPDDLLLRAIGEIRSELLGWIDERLESLREQQAAADAAAFAPARAPPEPAAPRAEPPAVASGADPRKRLDALARQLGERLR